MQSLESTCKEADFIINDKLKKLKSSNSVVNTNSNPNAINSVSAGYNTSSTSVLKQQHQQQLLYHHPQYHHLQTALQATSKIQQLSPTQSLSPGVSNINLNYTGKVTQLDSRLLQNSSKISNQQTYIYDDGIKLPTDSTAATVQGQELCVGINDITSSLLSRTNSSANSSNRISITSPATKVVSEHKGLKSTGINSTCMSTAINAAENMSNIAVAATSPLLLYSSQQMNINNNSNNNNSNSSSSSSSSTSYNSKKAEKRPSSSSSHSSAISNSHHSHLMPSGSSSPTVSPSKRIKKESSSSRKSSSPSNYSRSSSSSVSSSSSSSTSTKRESSSSATTSSTSSASSSSSSSATSSTKFINIHEKIKELYTTLLANDINSFLESGLKQRSRSFILERLVEYENLNTIVVNLYPGNKGYSLAMHYDGRKVLSQVGDLSSTEQLNTLGVGGSGTSINSAGIDNSSIIGSTSANVKSGSSLEDMLLTEVLHWPYEDNLLLDCIDREVLPDFLMHLLVAPTLTLSQDDSEPPLTYAKPNVFYSGCVIVQIRDFRQTFAISSNVCDTKYVLLRPTNSTIFTEVHNLALTTNMNYAAAVLSSSSSSSSSAVVPSASTAEDKLILESQLVLATAEPLCLDPDPCIGRIAINSQHQRQIFNTSEMRRQMKKCSMISINRKRKLDQFTHNYGLELCDYLSRLRSRQKAKNLNTGVSSIRQPRQEYSVNLKLPEHMISVEKVAKPLKPPPNYELSSSNDSLSDKNMYIPKEPHPGFDYQPRLIEEHILETERKDNVGRLVIYHIKLSIFQRPSNSEFLGELYVDRDYRKGQRNGESCKFSLGSREHAVRYIHQFTEIFTEEGRKAVKITKLVPGEMPKVTYTHEQQQLLLQEQQKKAALLAAQQQKLQQQQLQQISATAHQNIGATQQQHVVVIGPNGQQQHIIPTSLQHSGSNTQQQHIAISQATGNLAKNINIVGLSANNAAAVQQVIRQQQQVTTQFIDANGATVQLQSALTANNSNNNSTQSPHSQTQSAQQQIQLHQIGATGAPNAHHVSLNNGSLVLVQQHPAATQQNQQQQQQTIQHAGITIQPANVQQQLLNQQQHQQQQKTQVITAAHLNAAGVNSALRTQLSSSVLQAQLKAGPILTTQSSQQQYIQKQQQQQLIQKQQQQQTTASNNTNNSTNTALHPNPTINAIVTSIMNSTNQWQQQQQQQQHQQQQQQQNAKNIGGNNNSNTSALLKNSSNASIRSLLNSAPAAMTSTPVASGTFTTSTGQQQTVTLVQHAPTQSQQQHQTQQRQTVNTVDSFTQATPPHPSSSPAPTVQRKHQNEVLQNLLNSNRKINIVGGNTTGATFRTNAAGNLIAVLNQSANQHQDHQQQQTTQQTVRVSMSALASQLASPPAIMTSPAANFGYCTVSSGANGGNSGNTIKILNSSGQQPRVLSNALRRDSNSAPPNTIVVGMAAPSPGSDSNASSASGFAIPQATNNTTASLNALLANASPSSSGSDHERLTSGTNSNVTTMPSMSPQHLSKALAQSPAGSSIHSPMSSPHPQQSPSPQHHQQQQQTTTTTLNLQGINVSTLQGAMANFPVQVQLPGYSQPISLQFSGNSLQTTNSSGNNAGQALQTQQRSLLVSVPVSSSTQQQQQHTITLQSQLQQQQHAPPTGTIVNLPAGASTATGTQTVVLTNSGGNAGSNNNANNTSGGGTTMLTLPIAQLVGPGVQKLNPQTIRTQGGGGVAGGNVIVQQSPQQTQQQTQQTLSVSNAGNIGSSSNNQTIQLVGTLQQRARNIQVVGTKQISNRQLIAAQRNIGGSTLKISTTPLNATGNAITSTANLTATPIVMSGQKLQLKTLKASQQQQQQQHRIFNQVTASAIAAAAAQQQQNSVQNSQQQQQSQGVIIGQQQQQQQQQHQQHIQISSRTSSGTLTQRTINALAAAAAAKQQQQQQAAAAANRRRSATDANK